MSDEVKKIAEGDWQKRALSEDFWQSCGPEAVDVVTNPKDPILKYLIWPTVERMRSVGVTRLTIAIRDGKVRFELIPEGQTVKL